jgi:hypothetical protein
MKSSLGHLPPAEFEALAVPQTQRPRTTITIVARQLTKAFASAVHDSRGTPSSPSGCRQT